LNARVMSAETTTNQPGRPLCIVGECTIFRAAELSVLLLAEPVPGEVDLSGVTEIDSAGLQILMGAKLAAIRAQRTLRLTGHSPAVIEVFDLLNVASYFNDPLITETEK
jgi:anti-sigma B factor antagonist